MKGCLESARILVLINGSPSDEFVMEKGLRQGDPIAHFLFLIIVEGLNGQRRRATQLNKFMGFRLGRENQVEIFLLQFADDTMLFGDATMHNALTLKCVHRSFQLISGLKINFQKKQTCGNFY